MMEKIIGETSKQISEICKNDISECRSSIEIGKNGDFSSRIAFIISKTKKENPAKIAAEIAKELEKRKSKNIKKIEAAGPYINFFLSESAFASIVKEINEKKDKYGSSEGGRGERVLLEFPSVNPNKPWHIGHLRNALLGDSIGRILEFNGEDVHRMDYIDDLGLQVAQSLWGVLNLEEKKTGKFDQWLGEQYVKVAKKISQDKKVEEEVRQILKEMEEGNGNIAKLGRSLAEECVESQYQTAFKYGIYHNSLVFESDIMREVFSKGLEYLKNNKAVVLEKEGKNKDCLVVKIDNEEEFGKMENPDKVLIRSDGTAVYTGKDVIFHLWKFGIVKNDFNYSDFIKQPNGKMAKKTDKKGKKEKFANATKVINVIGVEQSYPQKVIVEVLKKLKNEKEAASLKHLAYEQVWLPEGKFSGRAGTWVGYTADELAEEAKSRAREKIKSEFEEKEGEEIARIVGIGAIRFAFLKISAEKKITFKWEDALNMEGDSGPYVQYAYVRTKGILSKTKIQGESKEIDFNESERDLIKSLAKLREVSQKSATEMTTHNLAQYAIEVATKFSSFYANTQVINEEDVQKTKARLSLVSATGIVLKNTLNLLGIECPERM